MKKNMIKVFMFLCMIAVCISGYCLYQRCASDKEAKEEYDSIREAVKYSKKKGKQINWKKLKKMNSDVVGWIYIPNTEIDYPIVQGGDNEEYLHKTFQGNYNASGAIFLDYKCKKNFTSGNNVLYGHHMRNGSMFAGLTKFRNQSYVKKHPYAYIYTPNRTIRLKLLSAYAKSGYHANIPIEFNDKKEKDAFLDQILSLSNVYVPIKKWNLTQDENKNDMTGHQPSDIFTLITCSYEQRNNRTFVHAIIDPR